MERLTAPAPAPELDDRAAVEGVLARQGRNPVSFFIRYEAPWRYLLARSGAGAVAYLERNRVALVWGDPLAAPDDQTSLLDEMTDVLRERGLRVGLLLVGEDTASRALERGYGVLKVGEQPRFDLQQWRQPRGDPGKHLRWCLNRAAGAGIRVRAYEAGDEGRVAEALSLWAAGLGRAPAQSFLRASPLALADEKRIFLAESAGRLEAVVACAPVPAASGWLLEDLIRRPDAPTGATEALVVEALRHLGAEGAACAWMDIAPLRGTDRQLDRRARFLFRVAAPTVAFFDARYHFRALTTYLGKFQPTSWEPRYVALNPAMPTVGLVRALTAIL